jgi:hypothetical protein
VCVYILHSVELFYIYKRVYKYTHKYIVFDTVDAAMHLV